MGLESAIMGLKKEQVGKKASLFSAGVAVDGGFEGRGPKHAKGFYQE